MHPLGVEPSVMQIEVLNGPLQEIKIIFTKGDIDERTRENH